MTATLTPTEQKSEEVVIHFRPVLNKLTEDEFYEFCMANKDLRIELTSEGDLIIMPPTGLKTGNLNAKLTARLVTWAERDGTGMVFDSSSLFTLPNDAKRSPDASWLSKEKWEALTGKEQERFAPVCPDFVVELRSPSDSLRAVQKKMEEYVANGVQLGWLLDPFERKVYVYRPGAAAEVLDDPETVSGEPLLRGFVLDVRAIWE